MDETTKTLKPELLAIIEERFAALVAGDWELPVVQSALKNELRTITKVLEAGTRHFNPYEFATLII